MYKNALMTKINTKIKTSEKEGMYLIYCNKMFDRVFPHFCKRAFFFPVSHTCSRAEYSRTLKQHPAAHFAPLFLNLAAGIIHHPCRHQSNNVRQAQSPSHIEPVPTTWPAPTTILLFPPPTFLLLRCFFNEEKPNIADTTLLHPYFVFLI